MRLIDANALQEEYKSQHNGKRLLLIDVAPTVDAVPVVRCKDCKRVYCRTYQDWQEPIYTCTHFRNKWNTGFDMEVNPDDYCSYGGRRTDGTAD